MPKLLSPTGFNITGDSAPAKFMIFLDSVLRGIGQVMFQNNTYAGILFLAGVFHSSALCGIAALTGTMISTGTAILLGANATKIRDGLFGFNGALTAIGLIYFFEPSVLAWGYVIFAAASSTVLMAAALKYFENRNLPTLTAPFVFTTLCFLLASARFGRLSTTQVLPHAGLPVSADVEGIVSLNTVFEGLIHGISQVFFQENLVTGILFTLGLLISSRRSFVMALIGSILGLSTAWLLGASEPAIRSGAFGFNSVLTAIALGSVFLPSNAKSLGYAVLAAIVTTIAFASLSGALKPLGMPAMTLPFVVVTWIFLIGSRMFVKINPSEI